MAKKAHLKMMLSNLRKGSMTITEYFAKLRAVTNKLALTGSPVSTLDFITHLISRLGQPYYPVVLYIEANMMKIFVNEAYSMLLTHEARIKFNHPSANKEAKLNYAANIAQAGPSNNNKKSSNQANYYQGNQGNWNRNANWCGNNGGRGGFGRGFSGQGRGNQNNGGHWNNGPWSSSRAGYNCSDINIMTWLLVNL